MDDDGIGGSGYTLDDLSDYLDRGRVPAIPEIDANPECQAVLDSLTRMSAVSKELVDTEAAAVDASWFDAVMREVTREVRAGRDIPLAEDDDTHLVITEGAIRAMVRETGDALPGVIVERTRIVGDVDDAEEGVRVEVAISVAYGQRMRRAADHVRRATADALAKHTPLRIASIDVTVDSLHSFDAEEGER